MNRLTRSLMIVVVFLVVANPALAGGYFLQVHGGFAIFDLDDVNESIDRYNDMVGEPVLDHINIGPEAGIHVGLALTEELDLGLGFVRQWASSGYARDGYLVELDLPADLYEVSLDYLPASKNSVRLGAGIALGMISSAATIMVSEPNVPDRNEPYDGLGFHFAAYAMMDVPVSAAWSVIGQMGLRHSLLNHLQLDGETVYNPDSIDDKLRFNYSGLFLRVGVKFRP